MSNAFGDLFAEEEARYRVYRLIKLLWIMGVIESPSVYLAARNVLMYEYPDEIMD
jgi:hypothetical protein